MLGRGIDQILKYPLDPKIHEDSLRVDSKKNAAKKVKTSRIELVTQWPGY